MIRTRTDASVRVVPLDAGAAVEVALTSSSIRVRGTDTAELVIRSRNGEALEDEVAVDVSAGRVRIREADPGWGLGILRLRTRRAADLDLEVPRETTLAVRTLSGNLDAVGIRGASRWTTASGDLRLVIETGPVALETLSGDAVVTGDGPLAVTARTLSGDVRLVAPRFDALDLGTTSGNIRVEGGLAQQGSHVFASVSGDVDLATASPVRVDTRSIAGEVKVTGAHRTDGGRGRRTVTLGAGTVPVEIRTTSGDIHVRVVAADVGAAPATDPATAPSGPVLASEPAIERHEAARLEILRALERGELDIDTASHRLETLEGTGPLGFRGWSR